ncbi:MAG: hypothetical protein GTN76_11520 [Candidatus Aenigmarchaeota archaeon]|nr:hypothetical protein [Candidatus Aenigmarchaeota archaeon]NIQ18057.1 hypothetical protein [Candidatus Aenigmarchaeota archaeon]
MEKVQTMEKIQIIKINKSIEVLEKRGERLKEEEKLLETLKNDKTEYMNKIRDIQKLGS